MQGFGVSHLGVLLQKHLQRCRHILRLEKSLSHGMVGATHGAQRSLLLLEVFWKGSSNSVSKQACTGSAGGAASSVSEHKSRMGTTSGLVSPPEPSSPPVWQATRRTFQWLRPPRPRPRPAMSGSCRFRGRPGHPRHAISRRSI